MCSSEGGIAVVAGKDEERSVMEPGTWLLYHFHCHTNGFLLFRIIWGLKVWLAVFLSWRGSLGTGVWRETWCWGVYCFLAHSGCKALGSPLIKYSHACLSLFPTCTPVLTGTLADVKAVPFTWQGGWYYGDSPASEVRELNSGSPRPLSNLFHAFGLIT